MRTDLIADMLTLVRNANRARKETADVPFSKINMEILRILKREGFIENYKKMDTPRGGAIRVYLRYGKGGFFILNGIKRISKSGLRVYRKKKAIPRVVGGLGLAILSTSKGVMTDKEAKGAGVGGEILCYAW